MDTLSKNPLLGFIAGALAVVTAHQGIIFLLAKYGFTIHTGLGVGEKFTFGLPSSTQTWSFAPYGPLGVPTIVNQMFWGGLWGALYALIHDKVPGTMDWLKGVIYGLIITVISNWTLLPLIRRALGVTNPGQTALFSGGDPNRMISVALILSGFGLACALIYRALDNMSSSRRD